MTNNKQLIAALVLSGLIGVAQADEKEELQMLRNTTINLIKQLVKQGVLTEKMADTMIKQAEADAAKQVAKTKQPAKTDANQVAANEANPATTGSTAKNEVPADEIRVAYVPDFVKDEIRQQVRSQLREEVVGDVMQKAKDETWGTPDSVPEWTKRFKLSGDLRLRDQDNFMGANNVSTTNFAENPYLNYQQINATNLNNITNGGATRSALGNNPIGAAAFLNTSQNQYLARERFRLGIDANVTDGVDASIRLATGNTPNPVSTNQTMGNTGAQYQFALDRAYLRYTGLDDKKFNWLTAMAGRTPNPFFSAGSELVWDEDLSFEGAAITLRQRIGVDDLSDEIAGKGPTVFATGGVFPLQATSNPLSGISAQTNLEKWLFGGQAGLDWGFDNQDSLKIGAAYYDYQNISAKLNKIGSQLNTCDTNTAAQTQSAPLFVQGGNSMVGICSEGLGGIPAAGAQSALYGLAANYRIIDFNILYDLALFSPIHARFSADYARNIGFNSNNIYAMTGQKISAQTNGWQIKFDLGWSRVDLPGNWNVFAAYKYLERDAVLDAYTDSDFRLGGTNVKGWWIGGNYGLMRNIWLTGRWMSGDVISAPYNASSLALNHNLFNVDVLQLDLNSRF